MMRMLLLVAFATGLSAADAGMDPQRLARIPARLKQFVDKGTIAGAVTLVARHGVVASLEAVGYQDLEGKRPMRTDSIFEIMSMTKPVTAAGIMLLMEEGRLALSDPVEKHLPEFRGLWVIDSAGEKERKLKRPSRPITIRDLLTHTSGMAGVLPEGIKELIPRLDRTLAEAVAFYSQQSLEFEPGTRWMYSNTGIATLGRIIEVVWGQAYEKFLDARLFQPLGMKDSFFFPPADKRERIALVYRLEQGKLRRPPEAVGPEPWEYRKGAKYSLPEGGMYSTAADLHAFYQMMANGGTYNQRRILSRGSVELMTALHTAELKQSWGLGWSVVRDGPGTLNLESPGTFGHGGAFGTYGWIDPRKDLIGVFLIQRLGDGGNDERNVFMALAAAAIAE